MFCPCPRWCTWSMQTKSCSTSLWKCHVQVLTFLYWCWHRRLVHLVHPHCRPLNPHVSCTYLMQLITSYSFDGQARTLRLKTTAWSTETRQEGCTREGHKARGVHKRGVWSTPQGKPQLWLCLQVYGYLYPYPFIYPCRSTTTALTFKKSRCHA